MIRRSPVYDRVYARLRAIRDANPALQGVLKKVNRLTRVRPPVRFSGWGMSTAHEPPWLTDRSWTSFRDTLAALPGLRHTGEAGIDAGTVGELAWRHFVVASATRAAIALRTDDGRPPVLAECGVADGITAFVAMREASSQGRASEATIHLYDAWERMDEGQLRESERAQSGRYGGLAVEVARANLSPFAGACVFHVGRVPHSFATDPPSPQRVDYVHLDLNAAEPTRQACEFFWPRLSPGGVMLFDDYGWMGFEDTKAEVDDFAAGKPGVLLAYPTGQAMFVRGGS